MYKARRQITIRIIGLTLSGISAIISARIILNGLGSDQFAIYAFAVNIPNLLPFANLGISTSLLNNSSEKSFAKSKNFSYEEIAFQSLIILLVSASSIFSITLFLSLIGFFKTNPFLGNFQNVFIILPIVTLLALALPLSIGFFFLQAEKKSNEALAIGYMTPIISLIGAFFTSEYNGIKNYWGLWLPSLGYLIACIVSFRKSNAISRIKPASTNNAIFFKYDLIKYILITGFPSLILNSTILLSINFPRLLLLQFGFTNEAINFSLFVLFLSPFYNLISTYAIWASPFLREISLPLERRIYIKRTIYNSLPFLLSMCLILISITFFHSLKSIQEFFPMPPFEIMIYILPLTILQCVMVFYYTSVTTTVGMRGIAIRILVFNIALNLLSFFCIKLENTLLIYPMMTGYTLISALLSYRYFRKELF